MSSVRTVNALGETMMASPWKVSSKCVVLLSMVCAGCGTQVRFNDSVEGTVKLEGTALVDVCVEYIPYGQAGLATPGSRAFTDDQGHYRLMCENQKAGAMIGKHRVVILRGRAEAPDPREPQPKAPPKQAPTGPPIPGVYASPARTPLEIEVTAQEHIYDLNLKRNP